MTSRSLSFKPDHGMLLGTRDDDHPQYYNLARLDSWFLTKPPNAHTHVEADVTDLGNYAVVGHTHLEADITDLQSYSLATHNHAGVYAPDPHTHDYVVVTGDTMEGTLDMGGYNLLADVVYFGDQAVYGLTNPSGGSASYGTVMTTGTGLNSYEGYSINGDYVFMSNSPTNWGIYNDVTSQWVINQNGDNFYIRDNAGELHFRGIKDGAVLLYHNNIQRLTTTSTGVSVDVITVTNEIQLSGGSASDPSLDWGGDTGFYEASNVLSVTTGGTRRAYFSDQGSNAGNSAQAPYGSFVVPVQGTLGSTAGNKRHIADFVVETGNDVSIAVEAVRETAGSDWTTMAIGFRRVTDATGQASLWFYNNNVGIGTTGPSKTLHVYGTFAARPGTTISQDAQWNSIGSSNYELTRNSSALKYKSQVSDASYLADVVLTPKKYLYHPEDGEGNRVGEPIWDYGFIADEIAAQGEHGKILGSFFEGEIDNYKTRGVMAVLAAKVNRLEDEVAELRRAA